MKKGYDYGVFGNPVFAVDATDPLPFLWRELVRGGGWVRLVLAGWLSLLKPSIISYVMFSLT